MSESLKISGNSICAGCNVTPAQEQCVQCFLCKSLYHAVCEGESNENHLGSKTMVKTYLAISTKSNFKFFCDPCLTKFEINMVETESQKIAGLENKVNSMENKLDEITKLLKNTQTQTKITPVNQGKQTSQSIWDNTEKLASVKAPPLNSVLVIKNRNDSETNEENHIKVEKTMVENNISVSSSHKNKAGDLVMVCETKDKRDELKNLVSTTNEHIVMSTPAEKRPSITIVGLPKEYTKEEVIQMLVLQNGFIKKFASSNDINQHIEIFAIRPLKNNANCYQVFANVTTTLREGLQYYNNKVTLGLTTCKVYDRYHVKRCNNCQHFGHYMRDCPTPETHVCGRCSSGHCTKDCDSLVFKCINCVRNNNDDNNHQALNFKCPSLISQQDLLKKRSINRLNMIRSNNIPYR